VRHRARQSCATPFVNYVSIPAFIVLGCGCGKKDAGTRDILGLSSTESGDLDRDQCSCLIFLITQDVEGYIVGETTRDERMERSEYSSSLTTGWRAFHLGSEKLSHSYLHLWRDILITQGLHRLDGLLVGLEKGCAVSAAAEMILECCCQLGVQLPVEIVSNQIRHLLTG
jgi:hypothetical protein